MTNLRIKIDDLVEEEIEKLEKKNLRHLLIAHYYLVDFTHRTQPK